MEPSTAAPPPVGHSSLPATPHATPPGAAPTASPASAPTPPAGGFPALRPLPWHAPFGWLAQGVRDFVRTPAIGLFYGACFVAMGWMLVGVFQRAPAYTLALSAGFLLAGPFLCLGLYHASRALERGEPPSLAHSITAWTAGGGKLAIFGFVLLVLEMLWGRASLVVFALSFDGMPDFKGSIAALLNPEHLDFILAYIAVGAVFAALIFAVSVVSMPMLLDRPTDAITAMLTSFRLVLTQPGVMLLWGALLTLIIVAAMLPGFAGLLVAGPVVGHASWHAYRAAVAQPGEVVPEAPPAPIR